MKQLLLTLALGSCVLSANAQTDTLIGVNVHQSKDYKQLSHAICDDLGTDALKANALYNWITHHIDCDIEKSKDPLREKEDPQNILRNNKTTTDGYAILYVAMCREAGLKAVTIDGYAKDWTFDNGDQLYMPRHSWAAVMIDGKWELADPLLGTGGIDFYDGWLQSMMHNLFSKNKLHYGNKERFVFHYSPNYFRPDPLSFRKKHIPADPLWQLTSAQMPLSVFESGDTAITQYNAVHNNVVQDNAALLAIAGMTEPEKIADCADRAFAFNNRYCYILGFKEQIQAANALQQNNADMPTIARSLEQLKKAVAYTDQQKKSFAPHYTELTRKNNVKNRDAKDYLRQVRTDNNILQASNKRYKETAEKHVHKLDEKEKTAQGTLNDLDVNNLKYVVTNTIEKKPSSPEILRLTDSVGTRTGRVDVFNELIKQQSQQLEAALSENQGREYKLVQSLQEADSLLANETALRITLLDNYDDPVKLYNSLFRKTKFNDVDTLHKYYLVAYDTIDDMQQRLLKTYLLTMDIYKNNVKDIEQCKKYNSTETILTSQYEKNVMDYTFVLHRYIALLDACKTYEDRNHRLFTGVVDLYKKEETLLDKMDDAEEVRSAKETKSLTEDRSFDERENDNRKKKLNKSIKEVEDIIRNAGNV